MAELPRVHIVDHLDSDLTRQFIRRMRLRAPANCTSTGKVLLALAPPAAREEVLRGELARLTTRSLTDVQRLRVELEEVGERGYAYSCDDAARRHIDRRACGGRERPGRGRDRPGGLERADAPLVAGPRPASGPGLRGRGLAAVR